MRWFWFPTVICLMVGMLGACKPNYPNCESDKDCPGNAENREWCVNGQCQACRPGGTDCGAGRQCRAGRCEGIPGYCNKNSECQSGVCENHRCIGCTIDSQCPGGRCEANRCVADSRKKCSKHDECAESEDCIDGRCAPANKGGNKYAEDGGCRLETVFFGYNEFELSPSSASVTDKDADCLKKRSAKGATLTGHTDPRGTQEYNLALSEKRAQSVKRRLRDLGMNDQNLVTLPRGELDANGTDESSWERDRRVEVQAR